MVTKIHSIIDGWQRGYKNPGNGLALRGPLSQFFSGIFLKKLDDAFLNADVHYLRYQDDIIIFCKTKRQLLRCRKRMMEVLYERGLSLSRKKSRMGCVNDGFHFLGIHYLPTQTEDTNHKTHANDDRIALPIPVHLLSEWGGKTISEHQTQEPLRIVPHPRTLRKARENVKQMVNTGVSLRTIRRYLHHFVLWWQKTAEIWRYEELLYSFIRASWDINPAAIAAGLLQKRATLLSTSSVLHCPDVA